MAGGGSFLSFTLGATIPLIGFLVTSGVSAFVVSLGASLLALAGLGVGISRLTHRPPLFSAIRQVALGGTAAAVTYGVGALLGAGI